MGTTTRGYPYPEPDDDTDVPGDMQALAEAVDADVTAYVVKSGDESVVSSTTLQNDDGLFVAVTAGVTYEIGGVLFTSLGVGGGIKVGWSAPSLSSMQWTATGAQLGAVGGSINPFATGNDDAVLLRGRLIPGATGLLWLRWAQQTSDAAATTVLSGSYLWHRRIA